MVPTLFGTGGQKVDFFTRVFNQKRGLPVSRSFTVVVLSLGPEKADTVIPGRHKHVDSRP